MPPYNLHVPIRTMAITDIKVRIYYPQIIYLPNPMIQNYINRRIYLEVYRLFDLVKEQGYFVPGRTELTGNYEIKNNQRGILSLTLSNFAFMFHMAHPDDHLTALTTDVQTGKFYELKDLFKPGSPYVERISEIVNTQIKERNMDIFEESIKISPDQDYYIADKCLVIFFQRYAIGPRPLGYPMFPIPIYELEDIIDEDGPLGIMIYQEA